MFSGKVFIGVKVSDDLLLALSKRDPHYLDLFLSSQNAAYLKKILIKKNYYIGKSLESVIDLPGMELMQMNVLSQLKQLIPDYEVSAHSILLIPYLAECSSAAISS